MIKYVLILYSFPKIFGPLCNQIHYNSDYVYYILLADLRKMFRTLSNIYNRAHHPAAFYLFKVNNGNTRAICDICSKLTLKTPDRHQ